MKNVVYGVGMSVIVFLLLLIITTTSSRLMRENELRESLANAVDNAVENCMETKMVTVERQNETVKVDEVKDEETGEVVVPASVVYDSIIRQIAHYDWNGGSGKNGRVAHRPGLLIDHKAITHISVDGEDKDHWQYEQVYLMIR